MPGDTLLAGGDRPVFGRPSAATVAEAALPERGGPAPAWRADGGRRAPFVLRAASVVGVRHRLAGQVSDDAYAWTVAPGRLVVAVADGVGSVAGSSAAATRAVTAAVELPTGLPEATGSDGPRACLEAANSAAEGGGRTTLVVVEVGEDGSLRGARVGDSSAFLLSGDGEWTELFSPPDPDRAGTETDALPRPGADCELFEARLGEGAVLVVVTDGVGDPLRDGPTTVAPGLAAGLGRRPDPLALSSLVDFSRQGCHDDRTLVAVWVEPAEVAGGEAPQASESGAGG